MSHDVDDSRVIRRFEPFLDSSSGKVVLTGNWRVEFQRELDVARASSRERLTLIIGEFAAAYEGFCILMTVAESREAFDIGSFQEFFAFCQGLRKDLAEIQAEMGSDSSEIRKAHESLSGDTESWQGLAKRTARKGPPDFLNLRANREKLKK